MKTRRCWSDPIAEPSLQKKWKRTTKSNPTRMKSMRTMATVTTDLTPTTAFYPPACAVGEWKAVMCGSFMVPFVAATVFASRAYPNLAHRRFIHT